jgi:peptidoglycan/LPS O-acetylase OafA/YrhL
MTSLGQGQLPMPIGFSTKHEPSKTASKSVAGARHPEIDWIKAIGIVTVVLIHSLPSAFSGQISDMDLWIGEATKFAVPGFLACSGFLFGGSRSSRKFSAVQQRLKRLLLPYIAFSVVAWCLTKIWAANMMYYEDTQPFILKLLFGSALGPYYYVFMIVYLVLLTPLVARIPQRAFPFALVAALLLQLLTDMQVCPMLPIFWQFRSPVRSLGPFLLGWGASMCSESLAKHVQQRRRIWLALLSTLFVLGGAGLAILPVDSKAGMALGWVQCYVTLALIYVAAVGRQEAPELICWLSNASYPIYLGHLFFITPVLALFTYTPGTFDPERIFVAWAAGLGNSASLVLLGRALLGEERARTWIG